MENKKLLEILKTVGWVFSSGWNDVMTIVALMPSIEVKEKKWNDKCKQESPEWYPLDLTKIETWSTYDRTCIELDFRAENDKIVCQAKIYDGEFLHGKRKGLRFTATLVLPDEYIEKLKTKILHALDHLAAEAYEQHLEDEKNKWIENFKAKIIEK